MFNIPVLDFKAPIRKNLISQIRSRSLDGVIIKNFLSAMELNSVQNYAQKNQHYFSDLKPGMHTWPLPFGVNPLAAKHVKQQWTKDGLVLENRLFGYFKELGYSASVPALPDNEPISFGSFRHIHVEKKDVLDLHVGNAFFDRFKVFYSKFDHRVVVRNQLSYFILLKSASNGGLLELFNMSWNECKKLVRSEYFDLEEKGLAHYSTVASQTLNISEGDLLVFAGGEIYHRVTPLSGDSRLTFGGFIGFDAADEKQIYLWS